MNKFISKLKKGVAVTVMMGMVMCAVAPCVQGASRYTAVKDAGRKLMGNNCYISYTNLDLFDERGISVSHIVGAKYGPSEWYSGWGKGTIKVKTAEFYGKYVAYHSYGVGTKAESLLEYMWSEN